MTATTAKPRAAYLVKRDARTRCTFGKVWIAAVKEGTVTDHAKLVQHAIKLKAGKTADLRKVKFPTLLAKVQKVLAATEAKA